MVMFALYLAIPKPAPNPAEITPEDLEKFDENDDGVVDRDEYNGTLAFDVVDKNNDGSLQVQSRFKWPLYAYRWSLGQDLQGGSSLRYELKQQDLIDAEGKIADLVEGYILKEKSPENAEHNKEVERNRKALKAKDNGAFDIFGDLLDTGVATINAYSLRESEDDEDDFDKLNIGTDGFNEDKVDALRRQYKKWNEAKQRKGEDLADATIETLKNRLKASGSTELIIAPLDGNRIEVKLPKFATTAETQRLKELLETTGKLEFRVLANEETMSGLEAGDMAAIDGYKYDWLELANDDSVSNSKLIKTNADGVKMVLVQTDDDFEVTGKSLSRISPGNTQDGQMAVNFTLKGLAVADFERLTDLHRKEGEDPRLLAVVIDNKVFSAYSINDKISGSVQLSGRFSAEERDDIINVLKSGSLNVELVLEGEESVGPSEGAEAVSRGWWSLGIGAILVFILAIVIYSKGLGGLTILNLITVGLLVMGAMAAGLGTLTMPGIAGIVLTLGMAIDANILINERIREEYKKNPNTRGAVEEGFKNAASSIVDANITTLLTAIILYRVGSGAIQGFALTLAIGIVATLYTALLSYRTMVFTILNIKRDVKFKMRSLGKLHDLKFNFLKLMPIGIVVSVVLVLAGGSLLVSYGGEVLGMEFRGGHTFRIALKEKHEREEIEGLFVAEDGSEFAWAKGMGLQPILQFNDTNTEGTGADRYDFRFPMQTAWIGKDEDTNKMLRENLTALLGDMVAEEGWKASTTGVTQVVIEAKITLAVNNEKQFDRLLSDTDRKSSWLMLSRNWNGNSNAAKENKDRWFGDTKPADVSVSTETITKDEQVIIVKLTGVAVTGAADVDAKIVSLTNALKEEFLPQKEEDLGYVVEGEPEITTDATQGALKIDVALLDVVDRVEFTKLITELTKGGDPSLAGATLKVTAANPDQNEDSHFTITTSNMTFSTSREDANHVSKVEGTINTAISTWLSTKDNGNEISDPFLLNSAIGATIAGETSWRALLAIVAALVVVVMYIRIRFASVAWGIGAVVALLHDSFLVVALIGLADSVGLDIKIDLTVVAAILTVIGYSLNDTIITYDRIRELLRKDRLATGGKTPLKSIINKSINQMLPRTVLTSSTTLVTTLTMLAFGGPLLRGFAFAMSAGVIVGTFSSIYIAGPILLLFDRGEGGLLDLSDEEQAADDQDAEEDADADGTKDSDEGNSDDNKSDGESKDEED